MSAQIPRELLKKLDTVTGKRARIVIDHIIEHGFITTEDLEKYGYKHPPRAIRDVREQGIPILTSRMKTAEGKSIAKYTFGDLSQIKNNKLQGRHTFSKAFQQKLYDQSEGQCNICLAKFPKRYLQIDHRIPYEIAGESNPVTQNMNEYMLLCSSCNRAKSWSCENCPNWQQKSTSICQTCYWANPEDYSHIALREVRRTDIIWDENEISLFNQLKAQAEQNNITIPEEIKRLIKDIIIKS